MHIELLFPVVLCYCMCLWQDLISDAIYIRTDFLLPLWSLKLFSTAKEPFNKDFSFFSYFSGKIPGSEKLHATWFASANSPLVNHDILLNLIQ